jgi:hypothetical protein
MPLQGTANCGDATVHPQFSNHISGSNRKTFNPFSAGRPHVFLGAVNANLVSVLHSTFHVPNAMTGFGIYA